MKTLIFACACLLLPLGCAYGDPIIEAQEDAGNEAAKATVYSAPPKTDVQFHCPVDYTTGVDNPCDGPSPCWQWMRDGILLPKGSQCQFDCVCATPNSAFGEPISCGCGGFCHAGGCLNSL